MADWIAQWNRVAVRLLLLTVPQLQELNCCHFPSVSLHPCCLIEATAQSFYCLHYQPYYTVSCLLFPRLPLPRPCRTRKINTSSKNDLKTVPGIFCVALEAGCQFTLADSFSKLMLATVALCQRTGERRWDEALENVREVTSFGFVLHKEIHRPAELNNLDKWYTHSYRQLLMWPIQRKINTWNMFARAP